MRITIGESDNFGVIRNPTEITVRSEAHVSECLEPVVFESNERRLQTLEVRESSEGYFEVSFGYPDRMSRNGAPARRIFRFEGENIFEMQPVEPEEM